MKTKKYDIRGGFWGLKTKAKRVGHDSSKSIRKFGRQTLKKTKQLGAIVSKYSGVKPTSRFFTNKVSLSRSGKASKIGRQFGIRNFSTINTHVAKKKAKIQGTQALVDYYGKKIENLEKIAEGDTMKNSEKQQIKAQIAQIEKERKYYDNEAKHKKGYDDQIKDLEAKKQSYIDVGDFSKLEKVDADIAAINKSKAAIEAESAKYQKRIMKALEKQKGITTESAEFTRKSKLNTNNLNASLEKATKTRDLNETLTQIKKEFESKQKEKLGEASQQLANEKEKLDEAKKKIKDKFELAIEARKNVDENAKKIYNIDSKLIEIKNNIANKREKGYSADQIAKLNAKKAELEEELKPLKDATRKLEAAKTKTQTEFEAIKKELKPVIATSTENYIKLLNIYKKNSQKAQSLNEVAIRASGSFINSIKRATQKRLNTTFSFNTTVSERALKDANNSNTGSKTNSIKTSRKYIYDKYVSQSKYIERKRIKGEALLKTPKIAALLDQSGLQELTAKDIKKFGTKLSRIEANILNQYVKARDIKKIIEAYKKAPEDAVKQTVNATDQQRKNKLGTNLTSGLELKDKNGQPINFSIKLGEQIKPNDQLIAPDKITKLVGDIIEPLRTKFEKYLKTITIGERRDLERKLSLDPNTPLNLDDASKMTSGELLNIITNPSISSLKTFFSDEIKTFKDPEMIQYITKEQKEIIAADITSILKQKNDRLRIVETELAQLNNLRASKAFNGLSQDQIREKLNKREDLIAEQKKLEADALTMRTNRTNIEEEITTLNRKANLETVKRQLEPVNKDIAETNIKLTAALLEKKKLENDQTIDKTSSEYITSLQLASFTIDKLNKQNATFMQDQAQLLKDKYSLEYFEEENKIDKEYKIKMEVYESKYKKAKEEYVELAKNPNTPNNVLLEEAEKVKKLDEERTNAANKLDAEKITKLNPLLELYKKQVVVKQNIATKVKLINQNIELVDPYQNFLPATDPSSIKYKPGFNPQAVYNTKPSTGYVNIVNPPLSRVPGIYEPEPGIYEPEPVGSTAGAPRYGNVDSGPALPAARPAAGPAAGPPTYGNVDPAAALPVARPVAPRYGNVLPITTYGNVDPGAGAPRPVTYQNVPSAGAGSPLFSSVDSATGAQNIKLGSTIYGETSNPTAGSPINSPVVASAPDLAFNPRLKTSDGYDILPPRELTLLDEKSGYMNVGVDAEVDYGNAKVLQGLQAPSSAASSALPGASPASSLAASPSLPQTPSLSLPGALKSKEDENQYEQLIGVNYPEKGLLETEPLVTTYQNIATNVPTLAPLVTTYQNLATNSTQTSSASAPVSALVSAPRQNVGTLARKNSGVSVAPLTSQITPPPLQVVTPPPLTLKKTNKSTTNSSGYERVDLDEITTGSQVKISSKPSSFNLQPTAEITVGPPLPPDRKASIKPALSTAAKVATLPTNLSQTNFPPAQVVQTPAPAQVVQTQAPEQVVQNPASVAAAPVVQTVKSKKGSKKAGQITIDQLREEFKEASKLTTPEALKNMSEPQKKEAQSKVFNLLRKIDKAESAEFEEAEKMQLKRIKQLKSIKKGITDENYKILEEFITKNPDLTNEQITEKVRELSPKPVKKSSSKKNVSAQAQVPTSTVSAQAQGAQSQGFGFVPILTPKEKEEKKKALEQSTKAISNISNLNIKVAQTKQAEATRLKEAQIRQLSNIKRFQNEGLNKFLVDYVNKNPAATEKEIGEQVKIYRNKSNFKKQNDPGYESGSESGPEAGNYARLQRSLSNNNLPK